MSNVLQTMFSQLVFTSGSSALYTTEMIRRELECVTDLFLLPFVVYFPFAIVNVERIKRNGLAYNVICKCNFANCVFLLPLSAFTNFKCIPLFQMGSSKFIKLDPLLKAMNSEFVAVSASSPLAHFQVYEGCLG